MITTTRPQIDENGRYRVMQVCQLLGIYRSKLKNYTEAGWITPSFYLDGRKFYFGHEILRFWDAQMI